MNAARPTAIAKTAIIILRTRVADPLLGSNSEKITVEKELPINVDGTKNKTRVNPRYPAATDPYLAPMNMFKNEKKSASINVPIVNIAI